MSSSSDLAAYDYIFQSNLRTLEELNGYIIDIKELEREIQGYVNLAENLLSGKNVMKFPCTLNQHNQELEAPRLVTISNPKEANNYIQYQKSLLKKIHSIILETECTIDKLNIENADIHLKFEKAKNTILESNGNPKKEFKRTLKFRTALVFKELFDAGQTTNKYSNPKFLSEQIANILENKKGFTVTEKNKNTIKDFCKQHLFSVRNNMAIISEQVKGREIKRTVRIENENLENEKFDIKELKR